MSTSDNRGAGSGPAGAWTDASQEERARSTLQYHWSCWGSWTPSAWMLQLAVIRDGFVVGSQGVGGHDFAVLREVHTGSWLGRSYQGQGIGTQMRAAVLTRRLRLGRADWQATRSVPVRIHGLPPCLPLFGLPASG